MSTEAVSFNQLPAQEVLPSYTAEGFKADIVRLHNELVEGPPIKDIDADKNATGAIGLSGDMEGVVVHYPRRSDKEELLAYAVAKAQECADPRDGALVLGVGVVVIHPFVDGNGRVSRGLYSDLMGAERQVETRDNRSIQGAARQEIDLGSVFSEDPLLARLVKNYSYEEMGISDNLRLNLFRKGVEDDIEATTLSDESLAGLSPEECEELIDAIGVDEYGNPYRSDHDGLVFSIALMVKNDPSLSEGATAVVGDATRKMVNIHDLLPKLSVEQKQSFVEGIWLQRRLQAQAAIDFVSDDKGNTVLTLGDRTLTLRDLVIECTKNLHK